MNTALLPRVDGWEAVDHARHIDWPVLIGSVLAWLLLAGLLYVLARAWAARSRYQAKHVCNARDREILAKELDRAESKTRGRIATIVVERSSDHGEADAGAALTTSLILTAAFAGRLPWDDPTRLVLWQLVFAALGLGAARALPAFRRLFISERRATEVAERRALEEFYSHGLHQADARAGTLVLVSLLERRAVVLGDEGAHAAARGDHWAKTNHAVLEGMRRGSLRVGLTEAIRRAGESLRAEFPRAVGDPAEAPTILEVRSS